MMVKEDFFQRKMKETGSGNDKFKRVFFYFTDGKKLSITIWEGKYDWHSDLLHEKAIKWYGSIWPLLPGGDKKWCWIIINGLQWRCGQKQLGTLQMHYGAINISKGQFEMLCYPVYLVSNLFIKILMHTIIYTKGQVKVRMLYMKGYYNFWLWHSQNIFPG